MCGGSVLMSMTSLQDFPQNQHRREAQEFEIFFSFDLIRVKTGRVYITSIQISIIVTFSCIYLLLVDDWGVGCTYTICVYLFNREE